jgi:hypothetical protein
VPCEFASTATLDQMACAVYECHVSGGALFGLFIDAMARRRTSHTCHGDFYFFYFLESCRSMHQDLKVFKQSVASNRRSYIISDGDVNCQALDVVVFLVAATDRSHFSPLVPLDVLDVVVGHTLFVSVFFSNQFFF